MTHFPRLRRELVIGSLFLFAGIAATIAFASGGHSPFRAHTKVLAAGCRAGYVAEGAHCARVGSVEGPIESFTLAEQRAMKQTAPFQTVAPGAFANAMSQRAKKQKSGGSWSPIGQTPLHADSPDYAGTDPVVNSGPSMLGWKSLSGRVTAFAFDPANLSRIFAAPA